MRILFLGAGGVGGYFGGRLMEAGVNVTFLVRPGRQAQLMEHRLMVDSPQGNMLLPVQSITRAAKPFDLVILTCKAYDLESGMEAIHPAIGPNTRILPLLNGLNHYDRLDAEFGIDRVMGGLCHIPITLDEEGVVRHLSPLHKLVFGARHAGQDAMVAALAEAFAGTRVDWHTSDTIMLDLWEKFFFLATLAGSTCLMRGPVGAINRQPGGTDFMLSMLEECRAVATAEGFPPRDRLLEEYRPQLTERASPVAASMARDLARGNRTEAEHILGDMIARGERHGLPLPLLSLALLHLRVHEDGVAFRA